MNAHETEAYEMGVQAAKAAASWIIDGNTKREAIPAVLALLDAGDPRADEYLPACPTLSGEWADDLTPRSLYERVTGRELPPEGDEGLSFETDHGATLDALANAWELGVSETFAVECERLLRAALDPSPPAPRIVVGARVRCDSDAPGLARVNGHAGRVLELFAEGSIARVAWDDLMYREASSHARQLVTDIGTRTLAPIVD